MHSTTDISLVRRTALVLLILAALLGDGSAASSSCLLGIRTGQHGDSLRVVLDLDRVSPCSLVPIAGTDDWVILVESCCPVRNPSRIPDPHPVVRAIEPECVDGTLRVYLRAKRPLRAQAFALSASRDIPYRYVVDFRPRPGVPSAVKEPVPEPPPHQKGNWKIIIDPGHGGRDPGASARGIKEKEVVLDVAKRIEKILDSTPGYEAKLTRANDRFLSLRRRTRIAEESEGDAFLSIHANAARKGRAVGVEVFFLSVGGASDEASRELARLENEADPEYVVEEDAMLDGIPFSFDLRQTDTIRRSSHLAESVLVNLESSGLAASRGVKQAGFAVLKSFQVPSVLVEIGFLSNRAEAKRLKTEKHRKRLAEVIAAGTISYFDEYGHARAEEPRTGE
jgi:N-acetylmuramoyl-L-alanine amidase